MDERDYKAINDELKKEHHIGDANKMVTAVEWLVNQVEDFYCLLPIDMVEQANEMEKEQIISAYKADRYPCSDEDAEQYYNETFKK